VETIATAEIGWLLWYWNLLLPPGVVWPFREIL